jgi:uncharacterized protein YjbJ (UPF0337 family)
MDEDRVEGTGKQMGGELKEGLGRMTGDAKLEAEGRAEKVEGKFQHFWGGLVDRFRHRDRRM